MARSGVLMPERKVWWATYSNVPDVNDQAYGLWPQEQEGSGWEGQGWCRFTECDARPPLKISTLQAYRRFGLKKPVMQAGLRRQTWT
jgi:hypothetical protein